MNRFLISSMMLIMVGSSSLKSESSLQKSTSPEILPLVVLGSGPAGLTAAQYGVHLGVPTTLISGPLRGGLLTQTHAIEDYPGVPKMSGLDFMDKMIEQTIERGVSIIEDTVVSVDLSSWPFTIGLESGALYRVLSLIIATGATPKKLEIPGEQTYWGRGVSSCAICDAHFFKGKDVVVVGGGDSAVEEALILAPHAKSVTILVRSHRMRAAPLMMKQLAGYPTIKPIHYTTRVTRVCGNEEDVTHLEALNLLTEETFTIKTDGLFLAIGHIPTTDLFAGQLALADNGHIIVDERTQATSVAGVFAAGDVEDAVFRQAIVAAGRGCKAAIKAVEWLREEGISDRALAQMRAPKKE